MANHNTINLKIIETLMGNLRPVYVPTSLDLEGKNKLGKALLAWEYNLNRDLVETLDLLARGLTYDETASHLNLKETKSVLDRVKKIKERMNMTCKQACLEAVRFGLGKVEK